MLALDGQWPDRPEHLVVSLLLLRKSRGLSGQLGCDRLPERHWQRLVEIPRHPDRRLCQQVPLLFHAALCQRPTRHAGCLCLLFHNLRAVCPVGGHRLRYGLPDWRSPSFKGAQCPCSPLPHHAPRALDPLSFEPHQILPLSSIASVFECGLKRYLEMTSSRVVAFSFACLSPSAYLAQIS